MEDVWIQLSKPVWWVSVVVAGIVINLVSSYMKGSLDRSLSATSRWWQLRSHKRQESWSRYVSSLAESAEAQTYARHQELRGRLQAITFLLFSVLFFLMALLSPLAAEQTSRTFTIVFFAAAALVMFVSYLCLFDAIRRGQAVAEAQPKSK